MIYDGVYYLGCYFCYLIEGLLNCVRFVDVELNLCVGLGFVGL